MKPATNITEGHQYRFVIRPVYRYNADAAYTGQIVTVVRNYGRVSCVSTNNSIELDVLNDELFSLEDEQHQEWMNVLRGNT